VDWLLPDGCQVAVELAAGTGLFTRAIEGRVPLVVAIEPDERMREILAVRSPGIRVRDGRAEVIPLPDACADAVLVSTAWHWFDPGRAVPEIARVLVDGGRLGVLWTSRDREEDWVAELDVLRDSRDGEPRTIEQVKEHIQSNHTVTLPEGAPFEAVQTVSFGFTRTLTVDDTLDWLATSSRFITAEASYREPRLALLRESLTAQSGGTGQLEMPLRSWCWRADRVPRG
jgi:SAM-dependent methyltransferase